MEEKERTLVDHFQDYFQVLNADTPELRERAYSIRYDVYCREFGYEREEDCPGGMEQDDYDPHSLQCLIVHRPSGQGAGCLRVVSPPDDDEAWELPMERFCGHSLNHPELHPRLLPRHELAEVSRLAVHTQFRRRKGESESPIGIAIAESITEDQRRTFPLLGLALFCAGTSLMAGAGRQHAFVMMERRLARMLQSAGFPFVQVGEPMEYHGSRAAYHVTVQAVLDSMRPDIRELHDFVHSSLMQSQPLD
ncbi:PEP-CTERM/exosortase system-associated acyltransferase [Ectothiorhodospira marina]|uniref:N-acyl amino acid synthase, PEP-CTERM/exosortase system-associated n=1 Tax=Ectothiorhodospira marina TaxID=1396821 RepID=A0A1H7IQS9_9GAMM|nr:PEP-CTERM/exosortase system-associated acyltransferase [Ectothiorhodospira marina]SEK63135.1 N-acyl amino acid synthase, PEP-CTERM/exosortase system-associated [Ectothiorhodospira marina]